MVDIPTQIPKDIFVGDVLKWRRELDDYPADAYTLTYYFSNAEKKFNIVATADGVVHNVSVAATVTTDYTAGRYRWYARADDGSDDIRTIEDGWLVVLPSPADQTDWRSHARKMLDAIEAALEGQADKNQLDLLSYSLGVVSVSRDRELLYKARDKYLRELNNEEGGANNRRHAFVRFTRP
jgi:hypothetical protein